MNKKLQYVFSTVWPNLPEESSQHLINSFNELDLKALSDQIIHVFFFSEATSENSFARLCYKVFCLCR